jgi:ACT domain-containing protein
VIEAKTARTENEIFLELGGLMNRLEIVETIVSLRSSRSLFLKYNDLIAGWENLPSASEENISQIVKYFTDENGFSSETRRVVSEAITRIYTETLRSTTRTQTAIADMGVETVEKTIYEIAKVTACSQPLILYLFLAVWLGKEIYAKSGLNVSELEQWFNTELLSPGK